MEMEETERARFTFPFFSFPFVGIYLESGIWNLEFPHLPIPFREFMARALYDPAQGYYGSGRAGIGRGGDFFTNVSVGPLFGRLLARQFAEMWERLGEPAQFSIVEQGAHRGDFARDVLEALRDTAPACFAAAQYFLVEPIATLRTEQVSALAEFGKKARWHTSLDDLPHFTGVHFSNELLDAMPVHLVEWTGAEWVERYVDFDGERFVFVDGPLTLDALRAHLATLPAVPAGYFTEVNLDALAWIQDVAARLERGWVLTIDYGFSREEFYAPERRTGTLRARSRHRIELDPLARPGELDLTAHVEFSSLVERAARAGLRLAGYTDQHHFMTGLGTLHFRDGVVPDAREMRVFKTLMHPTLMGTSFQALCFKRGLAAPLTGFQFARDPRALFPLPMPAPAADSARMTLGFIGSGRMATALVHGVVKSGAFPPADICVSDIVAAAAEKLSADAGVPVAADHAAANAIVLCVKPADALAALRAAKSPRLVISIVAGLPIAALQAAAGEGARIVRVMPNTPALIHQGATAYALGATATADDAAVVEKIFGSVGIVVQVKEEWLDAVTGLSGSGPAYIYLVIEALADAGVLMGLPRELSLRLSAQTVAGAAGMVLQSGRHPAALKDEVASPGGTTIAGLAALEAGALRSTFLSAVRAATERSRELGKSN